MDRRFKILTAVILAAGVLLALYFIVEFTGREPGPTPVEEDDSFPWVVFIPVFVGALVPIYARRNRDLTGEEQEKNKRFVVVGVLAIVIMIGLLLAYLLLGK
jgi:hypothetical protein